MLSLLLLLTGGYVPTLTVEEVFIELLKAGTNLFSRGYSFGMSCKTFSFVLSECESRCTVLRRGRTILRYYTIYTGLWAVSATADISDLLWSCWLVSAQNASVTHSADKFSLFLFYQSTMFLMNIILVN